MQPLTSLVSWYSWIPLAHDGTISINLGGSATTLAALDIAPTWEAVRPVRLSSGPTNRRLDARS